MKKMLLNMIMFIKEKNINNKNNNTCIKYTSCFATYKMGTVKQIDIKNRTYYFYNDIINIKKINSNLLKIDKKSYKNTDIYNIGYITSKKN